MSMNQIRKNGLGIVAGVMILLLCTACTQEPNTEQKETPAPTGSGTVTGQPTEPVEKEESDRAQELLDSLLEDLSYTSHELYNYPSDYMAFVSGKYAAMEELTQQSNYVDALLETYQGIKFLEAQTVSEDEDTAYEKECKEQTDRIVLLEILLATDEVFEQMSEAQKEQTLVAVRDKILARGNGKYNTGREYALMVNGFFAYIKEGEYSGSKWYEYIVNSENKSAQNLLEKACYPADYIPVCGDREKQIPPVVLIDVVRVNDRYEWAYFYEVTVSAVPETELTGEIHSAKEIIRKQYENPESYLCTSPKYYRVSFETVEEAGEYIGLHRMQLPQCQYAKRLIEVTAVGTEEGNLEKIHLSASYDDERVRVIGVDIVINTEYNELFSTEEYIGKYAQGTYFFPETDDEVQAREHIWYETTPSGIPVMTVRTTSGLNNAHSLQARFVKDGIEYWFQVAYDTGAEDAAKEILMDFINQY